MSERLQTDDNFRIDDFIAAALTRVFHRAIATFEVALLTGREQYYRAAMEQLASGVSGAAEANHVPLWWAFRVARHLCDGLWGNS